MEDNEMWTTYYYRQIERKSKNCVVVRTVASGLNGHARNVTYVVRG